MAQTNYVYWEILNWVVDGVNKTFTSLYPVDRVEEMYLGWATYRDFTFVGQTFTLDDAPTSYLGSPQLDYFRSDITPLPSSTTTTFGSVIDRTYLRLGRAKTSPQFPIDLVKYYINEGSRVINNKKTNPKYKVNSYSFNKTKDYVATEYNANKIEVGTISSYVPTNGKIMVSSAEIVSYSNTTTSAFGWLSWLEIVYKAGDRICVWYRIPNGIKKISEIVLNKTILNFKDRREFYIGKDNGSYTIIDNYIFLPYSTNEGDVVAVNYVVDNVACVLDTDLIDFENEYSQVLELYSCYNICKDREDERADDFKVRYQEQLRLYLSYLRQVDGINNTISSSAFKWI